MLTEYSKGKLNSLGSELKNVSSKDQLAIIIARLEIELSALN